MGIDQFWRKYRKPLNNVSRWEIEHALSLAKNFIKKPIKKIVDLGCGTGLSTYLLKKITNAELYGVDYSKVAIDIARREYGEDINWLCQKFNDFNINVDLTFALGLSWYNLKGIINLGYGLSSNFILLQVSDWTSDYSKREWTYFDEYKIGTEEETDDIKKRLVAYPNTSIKNSIPFINSFNPRCVYYDQHRICAVFVKEV